ncbi:MAG: ABC transporter permease [Dehalococcoidia bacterium]|nr:ABC transporter permease [Dehalococcoidia bacterium]
MTPEMRPVFNADATREKIRNEIIAENAKRKVRFPRMYWLVTLGVIILIWQLAAMRFHNPILMPTPWSTAVGLFNAARNAEVLHDLSFTMKRIGIGFLLSCAIGLPLGFVMGYSRMALRFLDPIINSVRLIPMMAWVPLSIVWFGIGDGPSVFMITFVGVFPITLSTIAGVHEISPDFYHAARCMGASRWSIFRDVVVPGSLPGIMTGIRLALGNGWMSVI